MFIDGEIIAKVKKPYVGQLRSFELWNKPFLPVHISGDLQLLFLFGRFVADKHKAIADNYLLFL